VEFGLLGPLVVRAGGVVVPVTAGKQRVLLAALLVRANQVVATEELAGAVWGGRPPGTARVTLQNYVKRLRRALGPEGYERIVTRPAGYLVAAGVGELDVTRFAELSAVGRAAARAGAWEHASAQLAAALSLWRGQPLADVPSPRLLAAEVPRLAEMRLAAAEARIDADLHLGRHREVIAEVAALAAAEPLRERLHELLMLALYRSGQQAAALAAYRTARRQLIDQIGIEPGPALRQLNQQILRSDPVLDPPAGTTITAQPAATAGSAAARSAVTGSAATPAAARAAGDLPAAQPPAAENLAAGQPPAREAAAAQAPVAGENAAAAESPAGENAAGQAAGESAAGESAAGQDRPGQAGLAWQAGGPRPAMLPAANPGFAGRRAELESLTRLAGHPPAATQPGDPVTVIAITGTAGVGKTTMAVHWARHHATAYPDGQLYLNLRGFDPAADPLTPAAALHALLDALGIPPAQIPATLDGRQALYRTLLTSQHVLILLDNARDPAQARPLLPGSPGPLTIITSRNDLTGLIATDGARPLPLDVLTDHEAQQLLAARMGSERLDAEPKAAGDLVSLCARLPLALAITGARAAANASFTLSALAAELRDARHRLDALTTGETPTDVRAVFSCSYRQLTPPAARMFRLLGGVHPGPDITAPAAASLAGCDHAESRALLRELTHCHLLTEHSPGRYALHDLLRAYATEQVSAHDTHASRQAAAQRVLDHYVHTACTAAGLVNPARAPILPAPPQPRVTPEALADAQDAAEWFEAERHVLPATVALAADAGFGTHAWQISWAMADFLDRQGRWNERAALHRIAVEAATLAGDTAGQAEALRLLAHTCGRLGDYDRARSHLTASIALYEQLGDTVGQARAHQNGSAVCAGQGDYPGALHHAQKALALYRAAAHETGAARALNDVGWVHALLGDYEKARDFCEQALTLHRGHGDRDGEAQTWDSLGYAQHQLGNLSEATSCYEQALVLFRQLGSRLNEATLLTHLGDTRDAAGDQRQARSAWKEALEILDQLRHPDADHVRRKLVQAPSHRGEEVASLSSVPPRLLVR
jgi:DNA-binding SARP family transcriptional activator/tetratricopeptide (TPR) repeat protein